MESWIYSHISRDCTYIAKGAENLEHYERGLSYCYS